MNSSPKLPKKRPDRVAEPLAGGYVLSVSSPGKGDLSDWVELMEGERRYVRRGHGRDRVVVKGKCEL